MKMLPLLICALGFASVTLAQTSPPAGSPRATALPAASSSLAEPDQLGLCVACHGKNGTSLAVGTPHLGGQDETYLRSSLKAYRDGSRKAIAMNAISNALQPDDIEALARWYAAQPGFQGER